jgi:2-hydroxycyclohexanecarboxyl-CoA dehydrogenase
MNILDLEGKSALITGAGQGVGRQIALHFAQNNAGLIGVNDFRADRAETVVAEILALGGKAVVVPGDVTDFGAMEKVVETICNEAGAVDMLVNNAGNAGADPSKLAPLPFWQQTPENWEPWLGVNLHGVLISSRLVLPEMIKKKGGSIVTIISDAGRTGEPNLELYSAAKAGAAGFSRALARTVGRHNIRVNCVAISATRTPAVARMLDNEEHAKKSLKQYVIRRFGEPEDIANMVLFVSSGAASWVTGQTYPVNGGFDFAV